MYMGKNNRCSIFLLPMQDHFNLCLSVLCYNSMVGNGMVSTVKQMLDTDTYNYVYILKYTR